jgi:hypothetical protein
MNLESYSNEELMGMLAGNTPPPVSEASNYSDEELMRELAGTKPPTPEPVEQPGLLSRIGTDIGNAYNEFVTPSTPQTNPKIFGVDPENALRVAGHLGRAAGDIMMTGAKKAYEYGVDPQTQKSISDTVDYLANTDIGKAQVTTLRGAKEVAGALAKEFPRAAEDVEAGLNALNLIPAYQLAKTMGPAIKGIAKETTMDAVNLIKPKPTPEQALGQVLQGKSAELTKDYAKGKQALAAIDTSDVKTYSDLSKKIDTAIPDYARQVDTELLKDPKVYRLDELSTVQKTKGGTAVESNYVETSIENLAELYEKTGDAVKAGNMSELLDKAMTTGLTKKEVNDLARVYGSEFKAFSPTVGTPLTSVSAQTYENVRSGLKEVARRGMGETAKELDSTMSALYNTRRLIDKNVEAANRLRQKIDERGLGEKIGRGVLAALDIATLGTVKGAVLKLLPRGLGYKVKNFIDLEDSLVKNLKIINDELKMVDKKGSPIGPTGPAEGPPPEVLWPIRPQPPNQKMLRAPYETPLELPAGQGFTFPDQKLLRAPYETPLQLEGQGFILPEDLPYLPVPSKTIRMPYNPDIPPGPRPNLSGPLSAPETAASGSIVPKRPPEVPPENILQRPGTESSTPQIVQPGATLGGKQPETWDAKLAEIKAAPEPGQDWPSTDEAKFAFSEMKSQLQAGAPRGVNEVGGETFAWGSSYPQWYRDIAKKHDLTQKETISFINKYLLKTEPVPRTFKGQLTDRQGAIYDDIISAAKKEAEPYARITEELTAEGIDPGAIGKSSQNLNAGISETLRAEGIDLPQEIIDAELDDYFTALAQKHNVKGTFTNETAEIPGASARETFSLANPETEISRGVLSKKDMTPTQGITFREANEIKKLFYKKP